MPEGGRGGGGRHEDKKSAGGDLGHEIDRGSTTWPAGWGAARWHRILDHSGSLARISALAGRTVNSEVASVAKLPGAGVHAAELLTVPASREKKRGRPKKRAAKAAEDG